MCELYVQCLFVGDFTAFGLLGVGGVRGFLCVGLLSVWFHRRIGLRFSFVRVDLFSCCKADLCSALEARVLGWYGGSGLLWNAGGVLCCGVSSDVVSRCFVSCDGCHPLPLAIRNNPINLIN